MRYTRIYFRFIAFTSLLAWCAGFTLNAFTNGSDISIAATPLFNFFYDNVCHQDNDKIISLNGFGILVCARCTGIYIGALVASVLLLFPLQKKEIPIKIFSLASFLLLTDVLLNNFVFSSYNKISAFTTGIFFGSICLIIVLNVLEKHFLMKAEH